MQTRAGGWIPGSWHSLGGHSELPHAWAGWTVHPAPANLSVSPRGAMGMQGARGTGCRSGEGAPQGPREAEQASLARPCMGECGTVRSFQKRKGQRALLGGKRWSRTTEGTTWCWLAGAAAWALGWAWPLSAAPEPVSHWLQQMWGQGEAGGTAPALGDPSLLLQGRPGE